MGISAKQAAERNEQRNIALTNLAKKRIENNLSQLNLATLSGISVNVIRRMEQRLISAEELSLKTLIALCAVLNCDIASILEEEQVVLEYNRVCGLKISNANETKCEQQEIEINSYSLSDNSVLSSEKLEVNFKTDYCKLFFEYLKNNHLPNLSESNVRRLEIILGQLSAEKMHALKLRYVDNLTNEKIACEVGLSVSEIEDMLMKSTRLIKRCFGEETQDKDIPIYNKPPKSKPQISFSDQPIKVLKLKIRPYDLLHRAGVKTVFDAMLSKEELMERFKMTEHMASEVELRVNEYIHMHIDDQIDKQS